MGKGWQIFVHSVRQVFGNLPAALRISGVLYLVIFALGIALTGWGPPTMADPAALDGGLMGAVLLSGIVSLVLSLWIAVGWHRYVLRMEGGASIVPAFRGGAILRYLGYTLLITIIVIPVGILGGIIAGLAFGGMAMGPGQAGGGLGLMLAMGVLVYLPVLAVFFRLSPVLPAAALDEPLGIGAAWKATADWEAMLTLAVLSALCTGCLTLLSAGLPGGLGIAIGIAGQWVLTMVGASILTTIYGHYIEKRQLVA